jgi:glucose-1-phosphate cytidylyltransferase
MKVVILAGGFGTRISEESHLIPKPMIPIGDQPILWHIMKHYSSYGFNEFIICAGYKQHIIKEYFSNYFLHRTDVTFNFSQNNTILIQNNFIEPWKVTVIDTGLHTMTGGRIKRVMSYIEDENFLLTYGDGLSDVNLNGLIRKHNELGHIGTITAVKPAGRFGQVDINNDGLIRTFREKNHEDSGWINGGFMVLNRKIFEFIAGDHIVFEADVLEKLSLENQIGAYKHDGFWQCMDSMKDRSLLEELLKSEKAPWKSW